jgi:hypothetical protein
VKFLFLIYDDGTEMGIELEDVQAWFAAIERCGGRLLGSRLRPSSEGARVSTRGGALSVTDGPFAETKEFLGGFDVIEAPTREDAIELASLHPVARFGSVVVLPLLEEGSSAVSA